MFENFDDVVSVLRGEGAASEAGVLCRSSNSSRHHPPIQGLQVWLHGVCATRPFYAARQGERLIIPPCHIKLWYGMICYINLTQIFHYCMPFIIFICLLAFEIQPTDFDDDQISLSDDSSFNVCYIERCELGGLTWSFHVHCKTRIAFILSSFKQTAVLQLGHRSLCCAGSLKLALNCFPHLCLPVVCRWPSSWMTLILLWPSLSWWGSWWTWRNSPGRRYIWDSTSALTHRPEHASNKELVRSYRNVTSGTGRAASNNFYNFLECTTQQSHTPVWTTF